MVGKNLNTSDCSSMADDDAIACGGKGVLGSPFYIWGMYRTGKLQTGKRTEMLEGNTQDVNRASMVFSFISNSIYMKKWYFFQPKFTC